MFLIGVLPSLVVFSPAYWAVWGWPIAVVHGVVYLSLGVLLTETLLWGFAGLPCTRPWRPEHANLKKWWPAYLGAFLLITQGVPRLTLVVRHSPPWMAATVLTMALSALMLRLLGRRQVTMQAGADDEPPGIQILNLE